MENETETFANRLQSVMKEKTVSRSTLAEILGVSPQQVSNYMTGVSLPDYKCLYKVATALNISADYLLGIETDNVKATQNMLIRQAQNELLDKIIEFCQNLKTE